MLKIGLDLDDTVNYWYPIYLKRFGIPKNDYVITKHCERILSKDKEFWTTLPIKNTPDFIPTLICTKRVNPKKWTREYINNNFGWNNVPIYQMLYQGGNKATMIKGRVDVFVDDSITNFIQMNLSGVPCLLMDSENNQSWGPIGRVYSLNYEEIEDAYYLFMSTVFNNFKKYVESSRSN